MPEKAAPQYRPMTEADVAATAYVRKAALEGLIREQGGEPPTWEPRLGSQFGHMIRTDPGGSFVAEIEGLVVGYAQGFVRGDIWFLAQLFVQPEVHGGGIGRELLRLAQNYGRERGARVFSVVASSSAVAQSLYMRAGMYCVGMFYRLTGAVAPLLKLPEPEANRKRIVGCDGWLDRMEELDRDVFDASRRQDHEFYLSRTDMRARSFGLTRDGAFEGYGYVVPETGWIAPLAAAEPDGQLPLVRMAAEMLTESGTENASMAVLSLNHVLMRALLNAGWQAQPNTYFLASEPFGKFDRYHPSGGLLL